MTQRLRYETYGFTYNSASQRVSQTSSNSDYDFDLGGNFNDAYTVNGLNENFEREWRELGL